VPTGIEHGTVTVIIDKHPFEVTTLRKDVETYGRHAKVEFGRDWKADAERRDFTINALSATRDGTIYDYTGGLADLGHRRVRFIGDPAKRIAEDYLRILRFFRFHAAYGTSDHPDPAGIAACIQGRNGLDQLSARTIAHGDDETRDRTPRGAHAHFNDRRRIVAPRTWWCELFGKFREHGQGRGSGLGLSRTQCAVSVRSLSQSQKMPTGCGKD
jgi:hypothetical protein